MSAGDSARAPDEGPEAALDTHSRAYLGVRVPGATTAVPGRSSATGVRPAPASARVRRRPGRTA
ncbi:MULTISPECIES: hypothetical protein [unclassified Streptomyces]|uniref:hypothetical protein n=1 Tax=unclassified Streptomyces TaxID=2593676 RepID=UPI0035E1DDCB